MTDTSERGIDMKYENVISLQNDLDKLIEKHRVCINGNDFGGALNIMKNIDFLTEQLKKIDYEIMVSKFTTTNELGKRIQLISIWKQNAFGDIKDIETYHLGEKYEESTSKLLEGLSKSWNTMSDEMKESIYQLFGAKNKTVTDEIIKSYKNEVDWYSVLEYFIKMKLGYIVDTNPLNNSDIKNFRGTGKTTALLKLSNDFNIPIYVDNYNRDEPDLKDRANRLGLSITVVDNRMMSLKQFENVKVLLFDEGTCYEDIPVRLISKIEFIGFQYNK